MSIDAERDSPLAPLMRVIPIVVGIFALALVAGGKLLAPTNIAWLQHGDAAQHYLGWVFYRSGPWTFPLGLNPAFGLEMASSIVYSDSIPLLAILFKPFDSVLPEQFQYFGFWVLACFVLQAWFGFRLARLMTPDVVVRTLVCVFFTLAPPMLFRLGGHLALAGHFLLLAALYANLLRLVRPGMLVWALLVSVAALVHAYLLVMVLAVWFAGLLDRVLCREAAPARACLEVALVIGLLALVCWQAGYFAVSGGTTAWGYGFYRMNLLSPIDPDAWSRILPDLPGGEGDGEGFGYLGLGMMLVMLAGLAGLVTRRPAIRSVLRRHRMLVLAALLMMVYAWSDQLGAGRYDLNLGYAGLLGGIHETFRASGRFFWIAYYLLMLAGIAAVVASYSLRQVRWILAVCLVVQIYDTSAGWRLLDAYRAPAASTWQTPLASDFWTSVEGGYDRLRSLPPANRAPAWSEFSALAAAEGMATDMVYLARINEPGFEAQRARTEAMLASGRFEPRTLYVLDEGSTAQVRGVMGPRDFIAHVDGFSVLVPAGQDCAPCIESAGATVELAGESPPQGWLFVNGEHYGMLVGGWSDPEPWGVWSDGAHATIQLPADPGERVRVTLSGYAYGPNADADVLVRMGSQSGVLRLAATPGEASLELSNPDKVSRIELVVPKPTSPNALGQGEDRRQLGIALIALRIQGISSHSR
ncbi:hypothetical protein CMZ82_10090 [Lysobacteraceae bacterium NML93-0792]|nr:hypothetical protein CMZ82_10090 [Xanthomonadaceae bacterium NML93-0792]PBS15284.1 hypothetical protein CMZ81_11435 [Xanthomonadaceae bacterium NML93-0793]PBS18144.1 hypothetical protein CMZ80_13620 [Xanthomonadaceae bacterium NML93-0831]